MEKLDSDLAWAKPYVDEARQAVVRGEVIDGDEFLRRLDGQLSRVRGIRGRDKR